MTAPARSPAAAAPLEPGTMLDALLREPQAFDIGMAVRIADASGERVELVSDASTCLAPSGVTAAERREGAIVIRSPVSGLVGAFGALPPSYGQAVLEEEKRRSRSLRGFLDVFAEPLVRLMVEASEKYRLPVLLHWRGLAAPNRIVVALLGLVGLRSQTLRDGNVVGDAPVLRHSGFFAARHRNAASLGAMLSVHTRLPVAVRQFQPRWVAVPESEQTALGAGRPARLGVDTMAGASVRDHGGGFRLVIGPVGYVDYLSLEPGSPRLNEVMALARLYAGPALRFDVQVVLRREDVPFCRLGDPVYPPKLGWNSWARLMPLAADSGDAIIESTL